jgi:hypothetical protein
MNNFIIKFWQLIKSYIDREIGNYNETKAFRSNGFLKFL